MGGKFHLKLNIGTRPIANKYREGKMKSTLKRELKVRETVTREPIEVSSARHAISLWYRTPVVEAAQAPCCGAGDYPRCTCVLGRPVSVCGTGEEVQKGDRCLRRCYSLHLAPCGGPRRRSACSPRGAGPHLGAVRRGGGLLAVPCHRSGCTRGQAQTRSGYWRNGFHRPVLKHGPRSLTYARVFGWQTQEAE